jgi:hypothetical protein
MESALRSPLTAGGEPIPPTTVRIYVEVGKVGQLREYADIVDEKCSDVIEVITTTQIQVFEIRKCGEHAEFTMECIS